MNTQLIEVVTNFGIIPGLFIFLFGWYIKTSDRRISYYEKELQKHVDWMRDRIDREGSHLKSLYEEIESLKKELSFRKRENG